MKVEIYYVQHTYRNNNCLSTVFSTICFQLVKYKYIYNKKFCFLHVFSLLIADITDPNKRITFPSSYLNNSPENI